MNHLIAIQKEKLQRGNPLIVLHSSCRVGNGIAVLLKEEMNKLANDFDRSSKKFRSAFFIPASGSGSRMFESLYRFIQNERPDDSTIEFVEHLLNRIKDFAFYNKLPEQLKDELENGSEDLTGFIQFIIGEKGFNFGSLPKGLIPFHRYGNFIVNPFQEHILQGVGIAGEKSLFHFTVNPDFEKKIDDSIQILKEITGIDFHHQFSIQNQETDAIAFDENFEPVYDDNDLVKRPSGHGALLENLQSVDADIIFIRNIDNVQHQSKAANSTLTRKALAQILIEITNGISAILSNENDATLFVESVKKMNEKYHLNIPYNKLDDHNFLRSYFDRPVRVCGMVKNEGQPGGGPFWIEDTNGNLQRQIVEKSQISSDQKQLSVLIKSTHFNPVEIVCRTKNYRGEKFNLNEFKNDELYFIVKKNHKGKPIQYVEEPGLWNGGMDNWLTVFYEIDSSCFSPVKTVLDLLKPLHTGE